ncbi:MAG: hypothetical protein NC121_15915 [Blautia sp.]|nr:hypothetical protein [Blautia sp.]
MKKLCVCLVSVLILVLLGGCADSGNSPDASNGAEPAVEEDTAYFVINRHGEIFNDAKDAAGVKKTLEAFAWMAPRSSGECIAENMPAQDYGFIVESIDAVGGSEDAEDMVWLRIVQEPVIPEAGSSASHKDYIFYREGDDACIGIQSAEDERLWTIWTMPGYGDWLEREIDIYLRMTTGL